MALSFAARNLLALALVGCGSDAASKIEDAGGSVPVDAGAEVADDAGTDATDGGGSMACNELRSQRPLLGGCVLSSATRNLTPEGEGPAVWALELAGRVTEVGRGTPPDGCLQTELAAFGGVRASGDTPPPTNWLRVTNTDGVDAVVAVVAPDFAFAVSEGSYVQVDFRSVPARFSADVSHLVLRAADDSLLTWLSFGGSASDLEVPAELAVERGAAMCTGSNQCVSGWTLDTLRITADGATEELDYGARAMLGDYSVVHGGLETQTAQSSCPDGGVAWAGVAAWQTARECGGFAGDTCRDDEYCAYEAPSDCGWADGSAFCRRRPTECVSTDDTPVCGCDGNPYTNPCYAAKAGTGALNEGGCD